MAGLIERATEFSLGLSYSALYQASSQNVSDLNKLPWGSNPPLSGIFLYNIGDDTINNPFGERAVGLLKIVFRPGGQNTAICTLTNLHDCKKRIAYWEQFSLPSTCRWSEWQDCDTF